MKLKTHKGFKKRIKVTGKKKLLRKQTGLSHFNARSNGSKTRLKRPQVAVDKSHNKQIKKLSPKK